MAVGTTAPSRDANAAYAAFDKGNFAVALKLARPLAEEGDARARSLMGYLYYHARGVKQDDAEALKWFRLAADQGDASAQLHLLGNMYAQGQGVPQDQAEAGKWYRLAADQGFAQAQYNLGLWYATGEGGEANTSAPTCGSISPPRVFPRLIRDISSSRRAAATLWPDAMTPEQLAEAQRLARESGGRSSAGSSPPRETQHQLLRRRKCWVSQRLDPTTTHTPIHSLGSASSRATQPSRPGLAAG